jgi:hypothetical protein
MYVTLDKWLSQFNCKKISYTDFVKKLRIKKGNGTILLVKDIKEKKIPAKFYKILYKIIVTGKTSYLTNLYNRNLKIKDTVSPLPLCVDNKKFTEHKNVVRSLYYKEIMQETGTSQPNLRPYLDVLIDLIKHHILDYKLLTPTGIDMIQKNQISSLLSGFYFRASIMNPIVPYSLSKLYDYKFKVLTPTLGWSSYLLGMLNNEYLDTYIGIDVIKKVCSNTKKIADKHKIQNDIYCQPSEDLYHNSKFMTKYKSDIDFIFFSPPYYQLELYKGAEQSTSRYKTYEEWLDKYWRTTMKLCYHCLKNNKVMMYIISGYNDKNQYVNLEKDMNGITKEVGFTYIKSVKMGGSNVGFTKHRTSNELIFIFSKGSINKKELNKHLNKLKCIKNKKTIKK